MNGFKLITLYEYQQIEANSLDYFDTYAKSDYSIGSMVYLRCYFTSAYSSTPKDILVKIVDIVRISYNTVSKVSLYRVYFDRI